MLNFVIQKMVEGMALLPEDQSKASKVNIKSGIMTKKENSKLNVI